ncbi:MAG: hypothetical protein LBS63_00950 [Prevotellaceae bacterium]|jgi:hypothetical protein|nr:hypothetical protein [Prevotellaceae bacterium]
MSKILALIAALGLCWAAAAQPHKVTVTFNAPKQVSVGRPFVVELIIDKQAIAGKARFQQDFPEGVEVEELPEYSNFAAFSFADRRLRLQWQELPDDSTFSVAYRATITDMPTAGELPLSGRFIYYTGKGEPQGVDMEARPILVAGADANVSAAYSVREFPPAELAVTEEEEEASMDSAVPITTLPFFLGTPAEPKAKLPRKLQKGLAYTVQLSASKTTVDIGALREKYKLKSIELVYTPEASFPYKYVSGIFKRYADAKRYADILRISGVDGAFIIAYSNGKQIPTKDARAME